MSSHMVSEYFELKRDDISSAIDNDTQDRQIDRETDKVLSRRGKIVVTEVVELHIISLHFLNCYSTHCNVCHPYLEALVRKVILL